MPGKVINMLTGVKTEEFSLVRRGANNKRIALTKSEESTMPISLTPALLAAVLATPAEGEAELISTLKAAKSSDEAVEVAVANFRIQSGFKDKLSKEQFAEVAKAAGFEVEKAKPNPFAEKSDETEDPKKPGFFMNGKKMPAKKSLADGMPEDVRKEFEEQRATIAKLEKSAKESAAVVTELRKEAELKGHIAKCEKEFAHVPGLSAEAMGEKLQKAYEVSEDFGKAQEKEWATVSAALQKSSLLQAQGITHSSDGSSAMGKVDVIAKELRSQDSDLTKEQAVAKALEENPELYEEYLQDNPAQRSRY